MNLRRDNVTTFVIALAVTVGVLVAGQLLWQKYAVAKPLGAGLRDIPGVQTAAWEEGKNGDISINVTLAGVGNLAATYGDIEATAKNILGRRPARIILTDSRTPELEALHYDVHFHLQEAIATGNFAVMAERVQAKAAAAGAEARVHVDARAVYLQLARGGAALYDVVPRDAREVKQ